MIRKGNFMAVEIVRSEHRAVDLRREAARAKDAGQTRRLLALAQVLDGASRIQAAMSCGMDRQTLRDWVHRYNTEGIAGLIARKQPGRRQRLTVEQLAELSAIVEKGPDPDKDGIVRWRRMDLRDLIEDRFDVSLHERSVGKILDRLGFRHMSVRPRHPNGDVNAQEAFKKTSPSSSNAPFPKVPGINPSRSGSRTKPASARRAA
jgi:transposase